jgi:hypothetical protein
LEALFPADRPLPFGDFACLPHDPAILTAQTKIRLFEEGSPKLSDADTLRLTINRETFFEDSRRQLLSRPASDFRRLFKIKFITQGVPGIGDDTGGIHRIWSQMIAENLFGQENPFFVSTWDSRALSFSEQSRSTNPDALQIFEFAGRLLAHTLWCGERVIVHLARSLRKQRLGRRIDTN